MKIPRLKKAETTAPRLTRAPRRLSRQQRTLQSYASLLRELAGRLTRAKASPQEVDHELLAWLKEAYELSA